MANSQAAPWWQQGLDGLGRALQSAAHQLHAKQMELGKHALAARFPLAGLQQQQPAQQQAAQQQAASKPMTASLASSVAAQQLTPFMPPSSTAASSAERRAELGRATWTLLHMLAAQLPEQPSRQQQRDVSALVDALTRIYPCGECARHFADIVKRDRPTVSSGPAFQAWLCRVHNTVNRSLDKPSFNCDLAQARWQPLDCGTADDSSGASCSLAPMGSTNKAAARKGNSKY